MHKFDILMMNRSLGERRLEVRFMDQLTEPMPSLLISRVAKAPSSPLKSSWKKFSVASSPTSTAEISSGEYTELSLPKSAMKANLWEFSVPSSSTPTVEAILGKFGSMSLTNDVKEENDLPFEMDPV